MVRRFEFIGGTSAKFWTIDVVGINVTVRFGRIGSAGQIHTNGFTYESQANRYAAKMVAEKLGKGYHEVRTTAPKTSAAIKIPVPPKAPAPPAVRSLQRLAKRVINIAADKES